MTAEGLPLLVDLVGFTAGGPVHTNWKNFGENVPERLDRLIGTGAMPPCVVAFPDCFTKLGGNQYINSAAMGRWADFLLRRMRAVRRAAFPLRRRGQARRLRQKLRRLWRHRACPAASRFLERRRLPLGRHGLRACLPAGFPRLLRALAQAGGSIEKWIDAFYAAPKTKDGDVHDLMTLAMCATYDPDPDGALWYAPAGDTETCELIPERWANFLPGIRVVMAETRGAGLEQLKALYIDCGDVDQYNLVYGAAADVC